MPTVVYSVEEFIRMHGGSPIRINPRTWLLSSGAMVTEDGEGQRMHDPPRDRRANLEARRLYHLTRLGHAEKDFSDLKNAVLNSGPVFHWPENRYGKPPRGGAEPALLFLKKFVLAERLAVAKLQEEIDALPEVIAEKEAARIRAERDADIEQARKRREDREREAIDAIRID